MGWKKEKKRKKEYRVGVRSWRMYIVALHCTINNVAECVGLCMLHLSDEESARTLTGRRVE